LERTSLIFTERTDILQSDLHFFFGSLKVAMTVSQVCNPITSSVTIYAQVAYLFEQLVQQKEETVKAFCRVFNQMHPFLETFESASKVLRALKWNPDMGIQLCKTISNGLLVLLDICLGAIDTIRCGSAGKHTAYKIPLLF
jgi:hypothetical protein